MPQRQHCWQPGATLAPPPATNTTTPQLLPSCQRPQPTWPHERRVQHIRAVGGRHQLDLRQAARSGKVA